MYLVDLLILHTALCIRRIVLTQGGIANVPKIRHSIIKYKYLSLSLCPGRIFKESISLKISKILETNMIKVLTSGVYENA